MFTAKLQAELDKLIVQAEQTKQGVAESLENLRRMRAAMEQGPSAVAAPDESKTNFEKVSEFLRSKGNQPQSTKAIMEGTGIAWGTLGQILYGSHKSFFVVTTPEGYRRKRLWALAGQQEQFGQAPSLEVEASIPVQPTLFGPIGDLVGVHAGDCCVRILREHGNRPMPVLTLAREALRRGYKGGASGEPDEILYTTAKSFWAKLGRDERFACVKGQVFRLVERACAPLKPPGAKDDEQAIENAPRRQEERAEEE